MPIEIEGALPEEMSIIEEDVLTLKNTFHVSLLCVKEILEKYKEENLEREILDNFCKFVAENKISFLKFGEEFRLATLEPRKAVLVRCEVSNLEKFSQLLSSQLNINIPLQPTHVTLYTFQPDTGIGLNSTKEMETRSKIMDVALEVKKGLRILS